jgi:thioredoxin-related protein
VKGENKPILTLMFPAFIAVLALFAPSPPPEVFRALDLEAAVSAARSEHKCVLVVFGRAGSAEAKKLDMTTWIETKVREWIALKAVPIKLDLDRNDDVATKLRIHSVPTTVFLNDQGREVDRITGYVDGRTFLAETRAIFGGVDPLERAQKHLAEAPDAPRLRMDVAMALGDRGDFDAALDQLLWCWDHGREADSTFEEARRTFLLRELMRLARIHPKTADALSARARMLFEKITTCAAAAEDVTDFLLLNRNLQQEDRTLAAFDALDPNSEACAALRAQLGPLIVDPLIDARRYAEAVERIGDPRAHFNRLVAAFRTECERLERDHPTEAFTAIDTNRRALRNQAARIHEALLGAKQYDESEAYAKLVLLFDGRGPTYCALICAALRVEAHGQAKALVTRALSDPKLTPSEKEDVRKLSTAIIQPK